MKRERQFVEREDGMYVVLSPGQTSITLSDSERVRLNMHSDVGMSAGKRIPNIIVPDKDADRVERILK